MNSVGHTKSKIIVLSYITVPYNKGGWVGGGFILLPKSTFLGGKKCGVVAYRTYA